MAKINFDDHTLSITNVVIVGLAQETHFEESSSELKVHKFVVGWKSIRSDSDDLQCRLEKNDDSLAMDCQKHAVRGSRASCQRSNGEHARK